MVSAHHQNRPIVHRSTFIAPRREDRENRRVAGVRRRRRRRAVLIGSIGGVVGLLTASLGTILLSR